MATAYEQGFLNKCAELGVDPAVLVKQAGLGGLLRAGARRVASSGAGRWVGRQAAKVPKWSNMSRASRNTVRAVGATGAVGAGGLALSGKEEAGNLQKLIDTIVRNKYEIGGGAALGAGAYGVHRATRGKPEEEE